MRADQLRPDLIITDVMMPKLDGWSLVRALRSRAELALVPVIFLTALGGEEDRIKGFRLGADDYLPKPFRFEELDLRVANALKKAKTTQAKAEEVKRAPVEPPPIPGSAPKKPAGIHGTLEQLGLVVAARHDRDGAQERHPAPREDGRHRDASSVARGASSPRGSTAIARPPTRAKAPRPSIRC